jgi:hypothetical protein
MQSIYILTCSEDFVSFALCPFVDEQVKATELIYCELEF